MNAANCSHHLHPIRPGQSLRNISISGYPPTRVILPHKNAHEVKPLPDLLLRRALLSMAAFLLLLISVQGCATRHSASYTSPVPEGIRGDARTVAVVSTVAATDNSVPRLDVPIGRGKEATKGGATGAAAGLFSGIIVSAAGGPLGPALAPIVIPAFTLGGGAGGAAISWSVAVPAEDAEKANKILARSRSDLSLAVAQRAAYRLPSVGKTAASPDGMESADLRIEVSIDKWGLAGGSGSDPLTGFFVEASYRVARVSDNTTVVERSFMDGAQQRTVSEWTRDNAALLSKTVDATLSRVAEAIIDGTFLVEDFRIEAMLGPVRGEVCGLRPISPSFIFRFGPYESGPPHVNSLTPRFKWESFPRRMDVDDDSLNILSRVSEVRYDLRIWKNEKGGPGDVVYERTGLVLSAIKGAVGHTLETPLSAESSYLWSVRARFRFDGRERVTRWSYDLEIDRGAIPLSFFGKMLVTGTLVTGTLDPYRQSQVKRRPCVDDSIPPLHYFSISTP